MKVDDYTIRLPEGLRLIDLALLDREESRGKKADYKVTFNSKCGEIILIEVTGVPEIRNIRKVEARGVVVKIIHHSGGVRTPVYQLARKYKIALLNCSSNNYIDLELVFINYYKELYNKC
ncbi:hypothetical protein PAE0008 [Pyrobaculum aerophilum str. IM2]|uniref:Uncharacterized protein n=1 Tax=Pyrobaculum aerophilum (strain ATCC 51768 / DSM 7523 / JCM 9630 / CIP 104966 / NBRC 100827 / IM2) TaxID=178306 RepID=Q8ZZZ2_PYRAE|nr:hypothetical protein PAE0008 [Pyrobaculum aerophilum str. IM2]